MKCTGKQAISASVKRCRVMLAVPLKESPPPSRSASLSVTRANSDQSIRQLFAGEDDDSDFLTNLPSVNDLLREVVRLHATVRELGTVDAGGDIDFDLLEGRGGLMETAARPRQSSVYSNGGVRAELRRRQSSVASSSQSKDYLNRSDSMNASFTSDLKAPPRRRGDTMGSGRPPSVAPRVAALTKENISLLRAPHDPRRGNYAGSVVGSQKSRTSVRTDGGAVFSRLYQPDFYKTRDSKLKAIRDRQENLSFSYIPKINQRSSVCSRDSAASSSVGSMRSAKTDILNVSSRLYDPDYMRKRSAKLQRMREEREIRSCTFAPTTNSTSSIRRAPAPRK